MPLIAKSKIPLSMRKDLEQLFFFNYMQSRFRSQIEASIAQFGEPKIKKYQNCVELSIEETECQCVFVLDSDELIAAYLYTIVSSDEIKIIHAAIKYRDILIFHKTLSFIVNIGKRISGIKYIGLCYTDKKIRIC